HGLQLAARRLRPPGAIGRIVRGMGTGLLLLLAFYSLLDESQRYSRMLLLIGSAWTLLSTLAIRLVLALCNVKGYTLRTRTRESIIVVGQTEETARVRALYAQLGMPTDGLVESADSDPKHLQDLIRIEHADSVVFCGRDVDLRRIIELMAQLRTTGVEYKIAPSDSDFIIGSESIISTDDLYIADLDTISTDTCRRTKRMFDIGVALLLVILSPILFWPQKRKQSYFGHCFRVLGGSLTWVGYTGHRGVFAPADLLPDANEQLAQRLMLRYMRHYSTTTDLTIILRNWNNI
ncbi:MAG: hypothetical protein IKC19_00170, partial [Bacteroidales bacterium]|nr:hypothetical protein [Bacteroidales bacterium]